MTADDPMRELFSAGTADVVPPDDARQAAGLAGAMSVLAVVSAVVVSAALVGAGTAVVWAFLLFVRP
ncbi:hypothetical protein EDF46_0944 [Frondihabitans sp. PhB188]|uniref:hypothetical protein n=1 Tax=Frondihabitans sp. PhB188 TaxID=2485200 RepID=UPI000F46B979|nr:hypothetical protein [Frondihabitans sp. PhB188]ROQ41563.1 hypothetical protein EDF46_0944 [Frondihabitans sp. PhB188]